MEGPATLHIKLPKALKAAVVKKIAEHNRNNPRCQPMTMTTYVIGVLDESIKWNGR